MKFLLDTNVVSEMIKSDPSREVLLWISHIPVNHLYISSITLGEINMGIEKLTEGRKKNDLTAWFARIQQSFQYQTFPVDGEVAIKWGELVANTLKTGKTIPIIDGIIAATAHVHGAILVTRNTKDFQTANIQLLNPWL